MSDDVGGVWVRQPPDAYCEPVQVDLMVAEDGAWLIRFATRSESILLDAAQWQALRAAVAEWEAP